MSDGEPPTAPPPGVSDQAVFDGLKPVASDKGKDRAGADESRFAGLRDHARQKEKWSDWLRGMLIISCLVQLAVLVAVVGGREMDPWTSRGVLIEFTASLRFLFE